MKIEEAFTINYGQRKYHNKENLITGSGLLISAQGVDNGSYGFFNISSNFNPPLISVPSTGSIGEAFVQTEKCSVDDNCLVLLPKTKYPIEYLFYVASIIRHNKWRFMYGRQLTPERIGRVEILEFNQFKTKLDFLKVIKELTPKKNNINRINIDTKYKEFFLNSVFNVNSGEYHSVNNLQEGKIPLISCSDIDNAISGFYEIPDKKTHKNCITVAYDGKPLTAKYHNYKFSAYDNVGVLEPKENLKNTTLIFITILINLARWRYGYGRKCYKQKLEWIKLKLPINKEGKINEELIEKLMKSRDIFGIFKSQ